MVSSRDFDFLRAPVVSLEALQAGSGPEGYGALLIEDRAAEGLLRPLAETYGRRLLLPECWQRIFPGCGVVISSALSGGSFLQRVQEAPRGRSWLLPAPMANEFLLPCRDGAGVQIPVPQMEGFFSPALLCQYTHFLRKDQGVVWLWDTEQTLQKKIRTALAQGFLGIVQGP